MSVAFLNRLEKSRLVFVTSGIWLIGLGLYFMFFRPPLLPEDLRFMGTNSEDVQSALPGLELWLRQVFRVMGGFITATGLLACMISMKGNALHGKWTWVVLAMTGLFSVGTMSLINFKLDSDFKLQLVLPPFLWAIGLTLLFFRRNNRSEIPDKR